MRLVSVDAAQPGMVLAAPVTDRRGRLLVPAETSLTERHVGALKMWGVTQIEVAGDDSDDAPGLAISPELESEVRAEIDQRFGDRERSSAFVIALRECVTQRRLSEKLAGGAAA